MEISIRFDIPRNMEITDMKSSSGQRALELCQ
jgi:hypothetical protein